MLLKRGRDGRAIRGVPCFFFWGGGGARIFIFTKKIETKMF